MSLREETQLRDILATIDEVYRALAGVKRRQFLENNILQAAIAWWIYMISDICGTLPDGFKRQHQDIQWKAIRESRNTLAHEYKSADWAKVWIYASRGLPELEDQIKRILGE